MKTGIWLSFLLMTIAGSVVYAEQVSKDIVVSHAWVRDMPPSQKTTAAYMTIENKSDKEMILQSVSAEFCEVSEMHKMEHVDAMMKMRKVDTILIPAKEKVSLEPGGFHLMLIDLKTPLRKGEEVPIVLNFQNGESVTVKAIVGEADGHEESEKDCPYH